MNHFWKALFILIDRWGLMLLGVLAFAFLGLAWNEAVRGGLGVLEALVVTLTEGAEQGKVWRQGMSLAFTAWLGWAAVRVYVASVGLKWDRFWARVGVRDHVVVVAGASSLGQASDMSRSTRGALARVKKEPLAVDLAVALAAHQPVVLCVPEIGEAQRHRLWKAGVLLITEDLPPTDMLAAAGVGRAKLLMAMRNDYRDNVQLCLNALNLVGTAQSLECRCLIEPLAEAEHFKPEDYFHPQALLRVRVFNEAQWIARRLLREFPPDAPVATTDQQVHVLMVGLGSVGRATLMHLARVGHYRSGLRPRVTVLDDEADAKVAHFLREHPALEDWLEIKPCAMRMQRVQAVDLAMWQAPDLPFTAAYVCTKDEVSNLRLARLLARAVAHAPAQAQLVALDPSGGYSIKNLLTEEDIRSGIRVLSLVDETPGSAEVARGLLGELDDALARHMHDAYCREDTLKVEAGTKAKKEPNNRAWEELTEAIRESNRYTAEHFEIKLRAIGWANAQESAGKQPDAQQLELLARMEHQRWWAEKALAGWRFAETRNNDLKHHPSMRPYDELSEPIKQLDRDQVSEAFKALTRPSASME